MDARHARHARHWDRLADRYDEVSAGVERRLLAASRPWVAGRAHGRVLEVGVGTGANLPFYPPGVELVCLERSAPMLVQARRRAAALGLPVTFVLGDAGALPAGTGSMDTVVSTFTLCCVPDLGVALAEMVRVLRPGGSLLLADHVASDRWWVRAPQALVDAVTVPLAGEHLGRRPAARLAALGLEVVEARRTMLGVIERVHARQPG
ncbi:class I SAM-dependent methyltransferase [Serinicoccus chungangensis]|uniref:class I SAM-dependent methyltransferase n=1 Tax=Serinicoccus chungangensis TaxID=767452 RepID=UPI001117CBB8|nr:methyltransferase domain-containing protein [Serinicoccus chungangensis]